MHSSTLLSEGSLIWKGHTLYGYRYMILWEGQICRDNKKQRSALKGRVRRAHVKHGIFRVAKRRDTVMAEA